VLLLRESPQLRKRNAAELSALLTKCCTESRILVASLHHSLAQLGQRKAYLRSRRRTPDREYEP
jgi:hypothetical protein